MSPQSDGLPENFSTGNRYSGMNVMLALDECSNESFQLESMADFQASIRAWRECHER
ncbi:hypothetical protein [Vibrio parahaemolyticus]|uniref:hypothetical protein n=1 Tax=Vibrio parahaemolyticus TaxID=670 RepID=UPI0038D4744F